MFVMVKGIELKYDAFDSEMFKMNYKCESGGA